MYSLEFILDIIKSGVAEIISEEELKKLINEKKKINIKIGFDPTSKNLHLGHFLILNKLKQFQEFGHEINLIIGDFTAMIGDPSGRNNSRKPLKKEEIIKNYEDYSKQIFKILNPLLTKIYFNSFWLNELNLESLLEITNSINISKILERNDFKNRYNSNKPISISEFIYPLLQGYDSVFIESDIEIGGIDQKLNFTLSRELQKKQRQKPEIFILMPILTGIDGKNKMSKSLNNCINIKDSPYEIYCKTMSIPDNLMKEYFANLFFMSEEKYSEKFKFYENPMDIKKNLAYNIVSSLYNEEFAEKAKNDFNSFFTEKKILADTNFSLIETDLNENDILEILLKIKFIKSVSEFKRFVKFGSLKINKETIKKREFYLICDKEYVIQLGKFKVIRIILKKK